MEIAEKDGRLGAGDDQDDEDQKQESVHVVNLSRPETINIVFISLTAKQVNVIRFKATNLCYNVKPFYLLRNHRNCTNIIWVILIFTLKIFQIELCEVKSFQRSIYRRSIRKR
jgi:hypothetical protein